MSKSRNLEGARGRGDILPPQYDSDTISNFFSGLQNTPADHESGTPGHAFTAIQAANKKSAADLSEKAKAVDSDWFDDLGPSNKPVNNPIDDAPVVTDTESGSYAYAKPATKGGGKPTDSDGSTKGGGKGGKKNKDDTATTDPTDPGTTDPTDPGTTDPTDPGGETNTGSSDPNVYVSGLDTPDGFNFEIAFEGSWTESFKQVVKDAAEYLSDVITADIPSYNGIDDIHIRAIMNGIDGEGGHLAMGGALTQRPDSQLTSEGFVRLDEADADRLLSKGTLDDVVVHELIHALGFGTIWDDLGLVETVNGEQRFTGSNAIEAYNNTFQDIAANDSLSDSGVPVSADLAHWDHGTFTHELMTTSLYSSGNYLSDMSIAALEDMGYETTYVSDEALLA